MNEQIEARLFEIMRIANKLSWLYENPKGYPLMQGSEVEKCILMALDDAELCRFREAAANEAIVKINKKEATRDVLAMEHRIEKQSAEIIRYIAEVAILRCKLNKTPMPEPLLHAQRHYQIKTEV